MSDDKKQELFAKIKCVEEIIREVEKQIDRKILAYGTITKDMDQVYASFAGVTRMLYYDVPYEIFMALSPKELAIEILRALSIDFNEYENQ